VSEDITEVRRIPEHAKQRLAEMRGAEGKPPALFTSDLSVNEFLMIEEVGHHDWAEAMAEFTAIGTAIRARSEEGRRFRKPNGRPFTSDLSGQEFWTLLRTGCRPVELAMGNCVYHVGRRGFRQALSQIGRNVEMPNYTQALYDARELALERMQTEAASVHAHGIVGVKLQQSHHGWSNHVIEFFAVGTAVVREATPAALPEPQLMLSLNDAPTTRVENTAPSRPATGGSATH
jgi:uncharacterized protein YbjQ (UPF0145 family)